VSRQVLPRQRTAAAERTGRRVAPAPARPARVAPDQPGQVLRRPAALALVAGATVALAGLGWMLVRTPGQLPAQDTSVLVPARTAAAGSPTPVPSLTGGSYAGEAEGAGTSRDPFAGDPATVAPTTQASPAAVVPGTPASPGISPDAVPTADPATSPQGGVPAAPTTFPVVTQTVTRTASPTVTPTVTATTTAPGSAIYVGFYAWNHERASFRVNARTYSYPVGTTFGPQLTFTSIRSGTPRCAVLTYQAKAYTFTLCPGQVVRLP
jgi:hypothetical protein